MTEAIRIPNIPHDRRFPDSYTFLRGEKIPAVYDTARDTEYSLWNISDCILYPN